MSPRKSSRKSPPSKLTQLRSNIFELQSLEIRRLLTTAQIDAGGILHVIGTGSADTITLNQLSNGKVSITGVTTQFTPGTQFTTILIEAGGGSDTVQILNNVTYSGSTITGNDGNDTITGGKSADTIFGAAGNDNLNGGVGNDYLDGNSGNDVMTGGDGLDTANYSDRTTAVKVTNSDGLANDGEVSVGEADNVDCEQVLTGAGNDTLTGSDSNSDYLSGGGGADQLNGQGGNDELTGGSGSDNLQGGQGDDYLHAQDGLKDTVNGGTGPGATDHDIAEIDGLDVASLTANATAGGSALADVPNQGFIGSNPADLDTSYGTNGKVSDGNLGFTPTAEAIDSQGRVVYVGTLFNHRNSGGGYGNEMIAARYDANGNRDTTFGSGGTEIIDFTSAADVGTGYNDDDEALGVVIDSSDNIFVLGSSTPMFSSNEDSAVAKLDSTGNLVSTFGTGGTSRFDTSGDGFQDYATGGAVQSNGQLVGIGQAGSEGGSSRLFRLTSTGSLDSTFNSNGVIFPDISASAVALQTLPGDAGAQRVVVGGVLSTGEWQLERFDSAGHLDTLFGGNGNGVLTHDFGGTAFGSSVGGMAVDSNQDILVAGSISNIPTNLTNGVPTPTQNTTEAVLAKFAAAEGAFVDAASHNGIVDGDSAVFQGVTVDSQGRYVVVGYEEIVNPDTSNQDFLVARVNANMQPDNTFGIGGVTTTDFNSYDDSAAATRVLSNGKIVAAGISSFFAPSEALVQIPAIARYVGTTQPGNEGDVENVEGFINYQDLHAQPPSPDVQAIFNRISDIAKNDLLWQPDDTGTVRINLTDKNDVVKLTTITTGDGSTCVQVNVNNIQWLYYDTSKVHEIQIYGNGGNDQIIASNSVTIPLLIDGGAGNDIIQGGGANDVIFGGAGIDLVNGNGGNDVIDGGDGIDALYGDGGRDIIIGGAGSDAIAGGADDDIEIAGTTSYDADTAANVAALKSLIAEWGQGTPVANRIAHIRTGVGGLNGANVLRGSGVGSTVFNDGVIDILTNDPGNDWFFAHTTGSGPKDQILFGLGTDTKDEI